MSGPGPAAFWNAELPKRGERTFAWPVTGLDCVARRHEASKMIQSLWDDEKVRGLSGLDRLVYRSNALGSDLTLTNTGGGNTSSKLIERDPLTGAEVEVLWVKGSGGDLRTAMR